MNIFAKHQHDSSNKNKYFLDQIIYLFAFAGPAFTIPQLIKVWTEQNAGGLSIVTWASWVFISCMWILYGITHRDIPIILANISWALVQAGVAVGILLYS